MKKALLFAIILSVCSIAFAEMTVFFKDGTSVNVTKIVFNGNVAELFLMNGKTRSVAADKIDLKASGIPKAEGSYGQAGLSSNAHEKRTATPPLIGDAKQRQLALKEEWDKAEQSAVALKTIGSIRQGDIVRIANRGASGSTPPPPSDYESLEDFDIESLQEGTFMQTKDEPFLVIFKTAEEIYGKKLFDSATFHSNFSINEKATEPPPAIVKVPEPLITIPNPEETPVKTEPIPSPEPTIQEEEAATTEPEETETPQTKVTTSSFPITPVLIGIAGIALAGGALFVYSRNRKKPFVNTSQFRQYENELRDFELEIWLKHGRTLDQLIEICLKKFYQDQPAALGIAIKIQKGAERSSVIQSIARQSGLPISSAEDIYSEMFHRISLIREVIRQVSEKVGKQPLAHPESVPVPAQPVSHSISATPTRKVPDPQPEISARPSQAASPTGLPVYLRNALKQLGELSD